MMVYIFIENGAIAVTEEENVIPSNSYYITDNISIEEALKKYTIKDENIVLKSQEEIMESLRKPKMEEVKQKFKEALANGSFYSNVLEAEVNKGPEHLRNVEALIEYMIATGETETDFRLYDNSFKRVTLDQLQALKIEMIGLGGWYYQRKWQLEEQIKNAQTEEELNSIVISF